MYKMIIGLIGLGIFWSPAVNAVTYYVATSGDDTRTGSNYWTNAVATISNGVALATTAGDVVMVSNGTYNVSAEISITRGITVTSAFGMGMATVDANYGSRCFNINHASAVVDGFNVIRGLTNNSGGGAYLQSGTVRHCVFSNNVLTSAVNTAGGGGICLGSGLVEDCVIASNKSTGTPGGGIYVASGGIARRCRIYNNITANRGGGGFISGILSNSWVYNNYSPNIGGGLDVYGGNVYNLMIYSNTGLQGGGLAIPYINGYAENCTIVSNYATSDDGGGVYLINGNDFNARVRNSIVYFNRSGSGGTGIKSNWSCSGVWSFTNCCIAPTNGMYGPTNINNIATDPQLVYFSSGDYRLKNTSPCINRGTNQAWMTGAVDLDGRTRIRYGTVDMGAYERINEGTIYTVH